MNDIPLFVRELRDMREKQGELQVSLRESRLTRTQSARGELLALRYRRKDSLWALFAGPGRDELVFEARAAVVYNTPFSS